MRPLRTIASTLAVAILATSCGADGNQERDTAANTQGVTDDTIVIGTHQPLTGPASPGLRYVSTGARAVFDHINENGGVHGRRIAYQAQDDSFDPAQTIESTHALIEEHEIFAMLGGACSHTHESVINELNCEGILDVCVSCGAMQ